MGMYKKFVLKSSIDINCSPEKIWNFFVNLEDNYIEWYPEEHQFFRWTDGKPMEVGSKFDSLEIVSGHKTRLKGKCTEAIPNKSFAFEPAWPARFICPKLEWEIQVEKEGCRFIARSHYKFGRIFLSLKKKAALEIMDISQKHMDQEGINLKRILE